VKIHYVKAMEEVVDLALEGKQRGWPDGRGWNALPLTR